MSSDQSGSSQLNPSTSSSTSTVSDSSIYNAGVAIGRIDATIKLVFATIIAAFFIIGGIAFIVQGGQTDMNDNNGVNVDATIANLTCVPSPSSYTCQTQLNYTYNNVNYSTNQTLTEPDLDEYKQGTVVEIVIDKQNPQIVRQTKPKTVSRVVMGLMAIIIGIVVFGIAYFVRRGTQKSKGFAAFEGASDVFDLIRR